MSNIKILYQYNDKKFYVKPYTTSIEKDILLSEQFVENDINAVLMILDFDISIIEKLSINEKIALLYKIRSISVGETIPIKYKCKHCSAGNDVELEITDIVKEPNTKNEKVKDVYKDLSYENMSEFVPDIDIEELDFDDYEKLFTEIKDSITTFDFIKKNKCIKCKKHNNIDISKKVVSNMSEDSLTSLYQSYNDLIQFGSYSKLDIDSMLPFERSIFIGLLNKTKEELK